MDIGNAKVGIGIAVNVIDGFLKELHAKELFPNSLDVDRESIVLMGMDDTKAVVVKLLPPKFRVKERSTGELRMCLDLKGDLEIRDSSSQPEDSPLYSIPLSASILLGFELKNRSLDTPILGLKYNGVESVSTPIKSTDIDELFARPEIAAIIDGVTLDIITPIIAGLEVVYYPDDQPTLTPTRDMWSTCLRLMKNRDGHVDAIGIFIGLWGDDADPGDIPSFLPVLTEFAVVFSRSMLDYALEQGAQRLIGHTFSDATITGLKLHMEDDAIHIWGQAEKDDGISTFQGPLYPRLVLGYPKINVDSRSVDVDIDLPWYVDLLAIIPPAYFQVLIEIDDVPDLIRRSLAGAMSHSLSALAQGTQLKGIAVQGVTFDTYPDHSIVENGCMALYAQVLVRTITETIVEASYSKLRRRFEIYKLASGRSFRAIHLAQLVQRGKVITPDYHDVSGLYMRANPDASEANNLLDRFKR